MPIPYVSPKFQAIDANGKPLVGGKLYTYVNATTTPQATYQDAAGSINNANPIILDGRGEAIIFLDEQRSYTFVLRDSQDALIWSQDSISGSSQSSSGITVVTTLPSVDVGPVYLAGSGIYYWNGTIYVSDFAGGFGSGQFTYKNRLINGDFSIWERGTSVGPITSASSNPYTANQWRCYVGGTASVTVARVSAGTDFGQGRLSPYLLRATSNAAATPGTNDVNALVQHVEGYEIANFGMGSLWGGSITLSFWVRSSIAGTYSVAVRNSGTPAARAYIANYTINAANTLEKKTITVPVEQGGIANWATDAALGLSLYFDLGSGTAQEGAINTWLTLAQSRSTGSVRIVGTSGATFDVSEVQLEQGTQATPFEFIPISAQVTRCRRYFNTSGGNISFTQAGNSGAVPQRFSLPWSGTMRAAPTVAITIGVGSVTYISGTSNFGIFGMGGTAQQENQFSFTASSEF